jgi:hypothetical protein
MTLKILKKKRNSKYLNMQRLKRLDRIAEDSKNKRKSYLRIASSVITGIILIFI